MTVYNLSTDMVEMANDVICQYTEDLNAVTTGLNVLLDIVCNGKCRTESELKRNIRILQALKQTVVCNRDRVVYVKDYIHQRLISLDVEYAQFSTMTQIYNIINGLTDSTSSVIEHIDSLIANREKSLSVTRLMNLFD